MAAVSYLGVLFYSEESTTQKKLQIGQDFVQTKIKNQSRQHVKFVAFISVFSKIIHIEKPTYILL